MFEIASVIKIKKEFFLTRAPVKTQQQRDPKGRNLQQRGIYSKKPATYQGTSAFDNNTKRYIASLFV